MQRGERGDTETSSSSPAAAISETQALMLAGGRQDWMVGWIDTDREPIDGLSRPRKLIELRHQLRHPLPEKGGLLLRDASVPDETPQLPVLERHSRLSGGDFEVIEVSRQLVAVWALLDGDVKHPCRAAVETLVDRPHAPCPYNL